MAVVGRPELVFLDEPTAGLDPQARRSTWDLIRELRADGVSVVLTTHFMDEAEELADDVAVIDAGRVIAQGSPEQLCRGGAENTLRFTGRPGLDLGSLLKALPDGSEAAELTTGRLPHHRADRPGAAGDRHLLVRPARRDARRHRGGAAHARGRLPGTDRQGAARMSAGTYTPRPGAAPLPRMIAAQAALETRMLLRNGEQLLLTVVIPTLLLVLFSAVDIVDTGAGEPVDFLAPGVLALAVMSTAFTGQAIATGFERRYGVLKRLGASPLPRWGLMTAKTALGAGHGGAADRPADGDRLRSGLVAAGQPVRRAAAPGAGHRGLLRARAADGGDAEGRGDAGRGQPGLPPAAGRRRGHRAAGQVPGHGAVACWACCRSRRSPTGSGTSSSTARRCPGATPAVLAVWAVLGLGAAARFFRWE